MSIWLDDEALAKLAPAERAALASPVPTQIVSNGEYVPAQQTAGQKRVEREIAALADLHGRRLGMDRRRFLKTGCGMAAAFLAMNRVYGAVFDVGVAEAAEPELAPAAPAPITVGAKAAEKAAAKAEAAAEREAKKAADEAEREASGNPNAGRDEGPPAREAYEPTKKS